MGQEKKRYGFYSSEAAMRHGTILYAREDGSHVEVTAVFDDPEAKCYAFPDKVAVGAVTKYASGRIIFRR